MRRNPLTVLTEPKCRRKPSDIQRPTCICHEYATFSEIRRLCKPEQLESNFEIPLAFVTNRTLMLRQISSTFNSFGDKREMQPTVKTPADFLGGI